MGAAIIGLSSNPRNNLKYIAMGASAGFIVGSILGSYIAFSPILSEASGPQHLDLEKQDPILAENSQVLIQPRINPKTLQITQVSAAITLMKF